MRKKIIVRKMAYCALSMCEAAERLAHLIGEIEKKGEEEAEQAEFIDSSEIVRIVSDVEDQKLAVDQRYAEKRAPIERETKIVTSKRRRQGRLRILAYQEKAFRGIVAEVKERVLRDAMIGKRLDDLLEDLFTQAVCRMNEPHVILFLRRRDFYLAKNVIAAGTYRCYQLTGEEFTAELDPKFPLEGEDVRVVISNKKGDIWITSGLDDRIEQIASKVLVAMGTKNVFGLD